jgi:M6 family metalloprotease-like protein
MGKQELRAVALGAAYLLLASGAAAVTSPRDGGPLPQAYFDAKAKNPRAFTAPHAWVQKAERLHTEREAYTAEHGNLQTFGAPSLAVTGTLRVPVLPAYFSDQATVPVSAANLQTQLFGANATGSVTDYYHEVSYQQLTATGDVYSWTHLSKSTAGAGQPSGSYYYGNCHGLEPGCSRTGEMITEVLDAKDATVDFADYDNDGPDGVPNSGDDDGFVDGVVFVTSLPGGECGTASFISNTYSYNAWPESGGVAYETNDSRFGGGAILIDSYSLIPALNCGATSPYDATEYIDIGTLCHELGHLLGLPDLYDGNGGGTGIGHWGIMGTGNWNTPEKPAHMDAWCKQELGWTQPVTIGWQPTPVSIGDAEESPDVYKLPFTDERFRRSTTCVIAGSYSLYCGLTAAEAAQHGYFHAGPGYGSNWYQTIERTFHYNGSGAVTLQFAYACDLELNNDVARVIIKINGVETQLAQYTGKVASTANIPLAGYLASLAGAGGDYTITFRVITDFSLDDSDGGDTSTCGAFAVDNVSVNGGGESYASGFETSVAGWHMNPNETRSDEYWLVENRRKVGFDANLHGEGLVIWHVDDAILHAPLTLNSGGGNGKLRGLLLEEAEGVLDLNDMTNDGISDPFNDGEAADVYPGPSNNTSFGAGTAPNSNDNVNRPTRIQVTGIGPAGATMTATLRAGDPAPTAGAILPTAIDNDQTATLVTVSGAHLRYGATFHFTYAGGSKMQGVTTGIPVDPTDIVPTALEWVDENTIRATVNTYLKTPGSWHLVVQNPDGQTVNLDYVLTVNSVLATRLVSAHVDVIDAGVRLRYTLFDRDPGETIELLRANAASASFQMIRDGLEPVRNNDYEYVDVSVEPGHSYTYLLESRTADGEVRELHRATAVMPARDLVLEQNVPNPFNPRTSIRFYLPSRTNLRLDVYDVRGALVRHLATGAYDSGAHTVDWDGTDAKGQSVASGFYVYRLISDGHPALTRKMMLLK